MSQHWMQTYTGKVFIASDPHPDQICIEDIAHSLSMLCRFNGHIDTFYSVAEHSVRASWLVEPEFALEALLHDAVEAYIGDMPSPIKRGQPLFKELEDSIWRKAIAPKFGLSETLSDQVLKADLQMLAVEKKYLITDYGHQWHLEVELPGDVTMLKPLSQQSAKSLFLSRFKELTETQDEVEE